ncbi:hypothetical protein N7532_010627 [Penicillium argentinense]|uniref:Importin N-terminal domain-containing protein n=1 Tax=Penicillium argentinense TaxID=1131581 RepID=A0A9W9EQ93_9EURO|nr:uncharacterized protein N7532_010627 [Penicillium argentinense]KAJ5085856.1 hypothetical protein N7532_010627 [Penicillium argentinense]
MAMVEVPGEVNPLTFENIVSALVMAASSNLQQVKEGTKQLQNWERMPTYHAFLQDAFLDQSAPHAVRYLSIIQLKNGIDKYWRRTATKLTGDSAIEPTEKNKIKTRALMAGSVEPSRPLAVQNALLIAKIMRFEFPQDWPEAMTDILQAIRRGSDPNVDPIVLPRSLLTLLQVIKELSTARIQRTRTHLQAVTPEIFEVVATVYMEKVTQWPMTIENTLASNTWNQLDEGALVQAIEQTLFALKVIRRLLISGFEHPGRDESVRGLWSQTEQHLLQFFAYAENNGVPESVRTLIAKHALQLSKLHLEMARDKPASFVSFENSLSLVKTYWGFVSQFSHRYADMREDDEELSEKIALRGLLMLRACTKMAFHPIHTFKYQTPQDKQEKKDAVEYIKSSLFSQEFVVEVMELIVTRFFRLRKCDFEDWEGNPEDWEKHEVDADAWEYSIHSCSHKLFLDLITHFKDWLVAPVLSTFQNFAATENKDVMLKDSLYSAIGLAAACLEQHLDINTFLQNTLIPEVQIQEQEYRILRRRIAIVLGQWVPIKFADMNMESVYQVFQHLLNNQDSLNDLVVRITAGRQLCNVLDAFDFDVEIFLPFAQPILTGLMSLLQEIESADTKMAMLESVRTIVVKVEQRVVILSDQIISPLPQVWENSGDEHLLKQAILNLLTSLMHSMNQDSVRYHSMILPLIQSSIDMNSDTYIYLLDEALELWAGVLMQTPSPASPEILSLLPSLLPILEEETDTVVQALEILESYILLAPQAILSDELRPKLLRTLEPLLESLTMQRCGLIPRIVEKLIRGVEAIDGGSEAAYNTMTQSLLETNILQSLLKGLYSAYEASQTTGPNRKRTTVDGKVETDYFSAIARLALANPTLFAHAVTAATNQSQEEAFTWLLKEWFFHYDTIAMASQKKLHVLALTQLLALQGPNAAPPAFILKFLQDYLTIWTALIIELAEGGNDPNADYLTAQPVNAGVDHAQARRRREWEDSDTMYRFPIRDFVRHRLQEVIVACGGAQRFQEDWLVNVDSEVVTAFGGLGLI